MKTPRFSLGTRYRLIDTAWRAFALLSIYGGCASAASWETQLENGQRLSVDPDTNRPLVESGVGKGRPLWDGVHRLQDGSTITIRSGVMVPNEALEAAGELQPAEVAKPGPEDSTPVSPTNPEERCDELVLKTCGLKNSCAEHEACQLAKQLREMQRESGDQAKDSRRWAEERCGEALPDGEQFTACEHEPSLLDTPCQQLVEHVCSSAQRCLGSDSCVAALDLIDLERSALERDATNEIEAIRQHCRESLVDQASFPPCR